jgi:hypothetical protein
MVIFLGVVIGQVEVAVMEEAVGHQEIVGFVPGEVDPFPEHDDGAEVREDEESDEEGDKFFL